MYVLHKKRKIRILYFLPFCHFWHFSFFAYIQVSIWYHFLQLEELCLLLPEVKMCCQEGVPVFVCLKKALFACLFWKYFVGCRTLSILKILFLYLLTCAVFGEKSVVLLTCLSYLQVVELSSFVREIQSSAICWPMSDNFFIQLIQFSNWLQRKGKSCTSYSSMEENRIYHPIPQILTYHNFIIIQLKIFPNIPCDFTFDPFII